MTEKFKFQSDLGPYNVPGEEVKNWSWDVPYTLASDTLSVEFRFLEGKFGILMFAPETKGHTFDHMSPTTEVEYIDLSEFPTILPTPEQAHMLLTAAAKAYRRRVPYETPLPLPTHQYEVTLTMPMLDQPSPEAAAKTFHAVITRDIVASNIALTYYVKDDDGKTTSVCLDGKGNALPNPATAA